jgi:tetratricopeptide (TPR) repeat protein
MGKLRAPSNALRVKSLPLKLVAQLLRSLDDPDALARNEFVRPLFAAQSHDAACSAVRKAVFDALEALERHVRPGTQDAVHRRRQYEVIQRYEIGGAAMNDVLAALSIEKSQFYRERTAALVFLARAVQRRVEALARVDAAGLAGEEQYRIASVLQRTGNAALAERVLEELLRVQSEPAEKVVSLVRLAELNVDMAQAARAQTYLNIAAQFAEQVHSEDAGVLACERETARAQLAWACGRTDEAQNALSRIIPQAQTLLGQRFAGAKLVLAKALAWAATLEYHVGTMGRCQTFVSMGRELLGSADEQSADVLAELLTIQTSIHTAREPTLADALNVDRTLLELARTHGLVRKIAVGIKDLAVINHYQGNLAVAHLYGDEAVALSTAVCGTKERAVATFQWAHICAERDKGRDLGNVFDVVARIRGELPPHGYWWGYSYAIESYLRLAESRIPDALEAAEEALSTFAAVKSTRGVGIAKSLHAQALHELGDRTQARAYAKDAVHLLETSPQSCWLSHARKQLAIA